MEWTFGQATLEGFLQGRKQAQQSDEFRQKLMQDARNESLINLIRQQQLNIETQKFEEDKNKPLGVYKEGTVNAKGEWVPTIGYEPPPMTENQKTEAALRSRGYDIEEQKLNERQKSGGLTPYEQYNISKDTQQRKAKYEDIINSQWYSTDQLTKAGISVPVSNNEWGGGWVVDGKFVPTKDQLERRARSVSGYFGKSSQTDKSKTKEKFEYK